MAKYILISPYLLGLINIESMRHVSNTVRLETAFGGADTELGVAKLVSHPSETFSKCNGALGSQMADTCSAAALAEVRACLATTFLAAPFRALPPLSTEAAASSRGGATLIAARVQTFF